MTKESELVIRDAESADKSQVLRFASRTWRWGDYIPQVWDDWLNDPNGRIFVGLLDGEVVGMNHVRFLTPEYAWLEGARVNPKDKRKGVATALARHAIEFSSQMGARIARLAVSSENEAAKAHLKKLAFHIEARFVLMEGSSRSHPRNLTVREPKPSELDSLWSEIRSSAAYRASVGLMCRSWVWYEMNRETLNEYVNRGGLFVASRGPERNGVAFLDAAKGENSVVEVSYIDGNLLALESLLSRSSERIRNLASRRVRTFAPKYRLLLARLMKLGLKEKGEYWVFSKMI